MELIRDREMIICDHEMLLNKIITKDEDVSWETLLGALE